MSERIENCKITRTILGNEDHGIFTAYLQIEGVGWGTSFGGYAFDSYNKSLGERIGTAYGCQWIKRVLEVLEVERWEALPNTLIRAKVPQVGGTVNSIGHIMKDQWFDLQTDESLIRLKAP